MKTYTEEFKKTIVELYEEGNKTKSELAREYGTSECNIRAWIKKYGNCFCTSVMIKYILIFMFYIYTSENSFKQMHKNTFSKFYII